jgi:hypothetical protein
MLISNNKDEIDNINEDTSDVEKYCQICLMKFDNKKEKVEPDDIEHKCINKCCIDCVKEIFIRTGTYNCPFCRKEYKEWIKNIIGEYVLNTNNDFNILHP